MPECRVPSGPAAREIATREPAVRSGRSRSPPVPSGPYGTRHAGCPWCWCPAAARLLAAARGCGVVPECRVPSGPAAREIATREPAVRSGRSRSPPVPSGPYGTRHAGCPWCWCPAAARLLAAARGCGVVPECRVPSGPAAREIATREPAVRSGRSRSPPVPSGPYGTHHAGCPWCLFPAAPRSAMLARVGVKKAVHPIRQARRTAEAPYE